MQPRTDPLRQILQQIPRILLIRLRSLGDSILTLPLIEALHQWRPELKLDILIEAPHVPVFLNIPAIHETLILKSRKDAASPGWSRLKAAREIRKRHYPAVLNLHGGTTSRLFTIASGAKLRIGQRGHRGAWIYNAPIPSSAEIWKRPILHTAEHQLAIMRWLDLPLSSEPFGYLHVDPTAQNRIRKRLTSMNVSEYFLIQPTATQITKQWNPDCFAQLGDWLFKSFHIPVIFSAAPHEISTLQQIQNTAKEQHLYWSDLSLAELFALIKGCRLFIGNDSGPTHAAAALKKPVVVIWGSSNFNAWHPWGTEYESVRSDLPCMPCPGYECKTYGNPKCIRDISIPRVIEVCKRMLNRPLP
jgi:ADP-heptose:LPS heptosyltransferase